MEVTDFKTVLNLALSDDPKVSANSVKDFTEKFKYKSLNKSIINYAFSEIKNYKNYYNQPHKVVGLLRITNRLVWSRESAKYYDFVIEMCLDCMQNSSGLVRESARKLLNNAPLCLDFNKPDTKQKITANNLVLLHTIEDLIAKNIPAKNVKYIEEAKPSVYKTLCIAWHDIASKGSVADTISYFDRLIDKNVLPYQYQMPDDEPVEDTYSLAMWYSKINEYFDIHNPHGVAINLKYLEKLSNKQLKWALQAENLDEKLNDIIIKSAKDLDSSNIQANIVLAITNFKLANGLDYSQINDLNKVIRAIQAVENNCVLLSDTGMFWNKLLISVARENTWLVSNPKKVNLNLLLDSFVATHEAVDAIVNTSNQNNKKFIDRLNSYGDIDIEPNDYRESAQVMHYIVDWIIQSDYKMFIRKKPKQIAVLVTIYAMDLSNFDLYVDNNYLAEFAGYKSTSSLSNRYLIKNLLEENMQDLEILQLSDQED